MVITESQFVIDQETDMDTTFMRQAKQAADGQLFIAFELAQRHWRSPLVWGAKYQSGGYRCLK
jgi:hypothetical protein